MNVNCIHTVLCGVFQSLSRLVWTFVLSYIHHDWVLKFFNSWAIDSHDLKYDVSLYSSTGCWYSIWYRFSWLRYIIFSSAQVLEIPGRGMSFISSVETYYMYAIIALHVVDCSEVSWNVSWGFSSTWQLYIPWYTSSVWPLWPLSVYQPKSQIATFDVWWCVLRLLKCCTSFLICPSCNNIREISLICMYKHWLFFFFIPIICSIWHSPGFKSVFSSCLSQMTNVDLGCIIELEGSGNTVYI